MATKNNVKATEAATPDLSQFVEEQITFPPYWNAAEDASFYAQPISRDERDPEFHRYVLQALMDTPCKTGPADDAEDIVVKKGEFFTCSTYAALPLELYMVAKVPVFVKAKKKREIKGGKQELWVFSLAVSPENKAMLDENRTELMEQVKMLGAAPQAQA